MTAPGSSFRPEICPNCGAEVPPDAAACPECGADEKTGWSEEARVSGLGLPEEEFDYGEFVQREFEGKTAKRRGEKLWWVVGIVLLLAFVLALASRWL